MHIQEDVEQSQVLYQVESEPQPVYHEHQEEDQPHKHYAKIYKATTVK